MNQNEFKENPNAQLDPKQVVETPVNLQNQELPKIEQPQTAQTPLKNPTFQVKGNNKKILLIAVGMIAVIGLFLLLINTKTGKKIFGPNNTETGEVEIIKVETSKKWGDKYAKALQEYFYKEAEIEINGEKIQKYQPTEFEIAFIDFEFDETPEMIVKYKEQDAKETIKIFLINNNEVSETKNFSSADFRLIYSINKKDIKWYLYITSPTSKKYGSYTNMSKVLNSTARDSDIKTTTDVEVTTFNVNYVTADFRASYYNVRKESIADDFKAAVLRYDTTNKEAEERKKEVLDNYSSISNNNEDKNDYIKVKGFILPYGEYVTEIEVIEKGEVTGKREEIITLNKDKTLTVNGEKIKFNNYEDRIILENKLQLEVVKDKTFKYGQSTEREYKFKETQ